MRATRPAAITAVGFLLLAVVALAATPASAQSRWIDATESTDPGPMVRDENRDLIYLGDSATNEVVVIDTLTEQVVQRIGLPGPVADMKLTKSGHALGVLGGGYFTHIELPTLRLRRTPLPVEVTGEAVSFAFDWAGRVFLGTGSNGFGSLYVLNWKGSKLLAEFGLGPNLNLPPYNPLLQSDGTGTRLYVSDRGLSPVSIHKFDITRHKNVKYMADDVHGSLGSNARDFALSPRFNELYLASGAPYGIQAVDTTDMSLAAVMTTGAYPAGVTVGPLGKKVFGIPSSPYNNFLFEFDAVTQTEIRSYVLEAQVYNGRARERGLAIDRFGEKAFVLHGDDYGGGTFKVQVIDLVAD